MTQRPPYIDTLILLAQPPSEAYIFDRPEIAKKYIPRELYYQAGRRLSTLSFKSILPDHLYAVAEDSPRNARPLLHCYKVNGYYLISDTFRKIIDSFDCPHLEYVPVTLHKAKGRDRDGVFKAFGAVVKEPYWYLNILNIHDAIDREKTVGRWYVPDEFALSEYPEVYAAGDPPKLMPDYERLVLSYIPQDPLFGLTNIPQTRFVSSAFWEKAINAGIWGKYDVDSGYRTTPFGPFKLDRTDKRSPIESSPDMVAPYRANGDLIIPRNFNHPFQKNS